MSISNNQLVFVGGSMVLLRPINADGTKGQWRDVGTLTEPAAPQVASSTVELKDSRWGVAQVVASKAIETSLTYDLKIANWSPQNLSYVIGSDTVATFTQASATAAVASILNISKDSLVFVTDASANRVFELTSLAVEVVASPNVLLVQNTDWFADALMLRSGYFRLASPAGVVDGTTDLSVTYSAPAISGARLLKPLASVSKQVEMIVIQSGGSGDNAVEHGPFIAQITPSSFELPQNNFGAISLSAKVLTQAGTSFPAGRMIIHGTLPGYTP